MSLILRQKTEELLKKAGLEELHTEIGYNKYLTLVTECGENIVSITGIKFSRMNPSASEINYATNLFNRFLEKNKDKLVEYITIRKQWKQLKDTQEETSKTISTSVSITRDYIRFTIDNVHISVYSDYSIAFRNKIPLDLLPKIKRHITKHKDTLDNVLALSVDIKDAAQKMASAGANLSKCDV